MKKWIWIVVVVLLVALVVPIPSGSYDDGGTKAYTALTYKIVHWKRLVWGGMHERVQVFVFPDNFKSIDSLWELEEEKVEYAFIATVLELSDTHAVVEPVEGEELRNSCDKISFGIGALADIAPEVGSLVRVTFKGEIMESYPAQICATGWELWNDLRHMEYTGHWIDKTDLQKQLDSSAHMKITKIYSNCFFATPVIPMPYEIKVNAPLSENWCVGDQIECSYENAYYDPESNRMEVDPISVKASDWEADPDVCYKPVIYLYPETEREVTVKLDLDGGLTCTYPAYRDGWKVTAAPDGTLTDAKGQVYSYLYWEGESYARYDLSKGFCVKGEDTAAFLEEALEKLGLTRREANEFIVYWLPLMEGNPYNIISFQAEAYTEAARLEVTPAPDTLIRVFMAWQALDEYVQLPGQELTAPERIGFTVVEWGGTEIGG